MLTPHDALVLLLLPFLTAAAIMLLAWRRKPPTPRPPRAACVTPLALAAALFAAGLAAFPPKAFPKEAMDWLILLPTTALAVGILAAFVPPWFTILLVILGSFVNVWALTHLLAAAPHPVTTAILLILPAMFLFPVKASLARRLPPVTTLLLWLMLAGATVIVESSGTAIQFGQYTLALPAALAGILLMRLFIRPALTPAATATFLLLWITLLTFGYLWADVPGPRTFLLLLAPACALPALFLRKPLRRSLLAFSFAAIPLAFAAIPAAIDLYHLLKSQTEVGGY